MKLQYLDITLTFEINMKENTACEKQVTRYK